MKKRYLAYVMLFIAGSISAQTVLTLEDCRQMALNHNKTLQIAQENVKAAQLLQANAEKKLLENKENPLNQEDKGVYDLYAKKQDEWKEAMRKNEELQKELEEEKNKRWWEKLLRK